MIDQLHMQTQNLQAQATFSSIVSHMRNIMDLLEPPRSESGEAIPNQAVLFSWIIDYESLNHQESHFFLREKADISTIHNPLDTHQMVGIRAYAFKSPLRTADFFAGPSTGARDRLP